jgi:hypothetical protein
MKLTQQEVNQRVDKWYEQNEHLLPLGGRTRLPEFKQALKHDLYLAQSVMRASKTHWSFKLKSVSTMYRWADLLNINVIRANDLQTEIRLKRNLKIIKMREKKTPVIEIAKKVGITVPAVYGVLEKTGKWRSMVNKKATLKDFDNSNVLGVFNDLFIAQAVKTNRYGGAGY